MAHKAYGGKCFCGAVEIRVTGDPAAMGFCHCSSCRSWSAGPVNAFSLWPPEAVQVVSGAEDIAAYQKSANSIRKWCRRCGGHLLTEHPAWKLIDVYAATIPGLPFKPGLHVNYQETVLHLHDGLPKMKDLPREMGGSGATLPE
ncbi:MAG TPA: GFA family protein [Burkholderiales bacterium]|nr:GFA family protein [Burkholderiales bacterium]